ncbi:MAG TPA: pitrilysin family protein [Pseudomonadota bacterium]|nr:pitrilysin family protein [Pseudomonadota bacterium]
MPKPSGSLWPHWMILGASVFALPHTASAQSLIPADVLSLENGMTTVLHVDRRQPSVAVMLQVQVGARHEALGRSGLAHLFEHLYFHGSEHLLPYSPRWYLQTAGVRSMNGSTFLDETIYYEVVPSENLEPTLWMESDRLGFPVLRDLDLQDERKIVKNERRQRREINPYGGTDEVSHKRLFPAPHPYFGMVIGEQTDLDKLTLDESKAFFRKYYDPKNVTLILSGDIDKTAAASLVKKYFGTIQSHGKDNTPPDPKPVTVSEEAVLSHDDPLLKEPVLLLRWLTPPTCSAEDRTADVLATILSRGKQGRLHKLSQKWPEQILSDGASQDSHRLQSVFTVHIAAKDRGTLEGAKELVNKELQELAEKGVTDAELVAAKKKLVNDWLSDLQSPLAKAFHLARAISCHGGPQGVERSLAQVQAVRSEDIQKFVKAYLGQKQCVVTFGMPQSQESKK